MKPEDALAGALFHQDAIGVARIGSAGEFIAVNRKFCDLTGFEETELLRRRLQDLGGTGETERTEALFKKSLIARDPFRLETTRVRKDGSCVALSFQVTWGNTAEGTPSALAIVTDDAGRRRAEASEQRMAQRYQTLFNSIDSGFCVIQILRDETGKPADYLFQETNAAFEKISGLSGATGRRMRDMVPMHEQQWFDIYGRVAETGEPIRFELEAKRLNRWFHVYAFRCDDPADAHVGVLFDDITGRRRADLRQEFLGRLAEDLASLHEERALAEAAVRALGEHLGVDRCYFLECSECENRIRRGPNYTRDGTSSLEGETTLFDFGGTDWWREYTSGDFAVEDVTQHPLTAEKADNYLALGVRSYVVQPFKQRGAITIVLALTERTPRIWDRHELKLMEDVVARVWPLIARARSNAALLQERAELERRVVERTATLRETITELEAYSYSISHDLRAPLRAMRTYATILTEELDEKLGAEPREYLRRIGAAADRMDRLIQDVLVFSRIARADTPLEPIELSSFVADILQTYPDLRVAGAEIEVAGPLATVEANPAGLTQCLSNLLGNAVKFVAPGTRPRIRLWTEILGETVRLHVRDNGIGIPAHARDKIFNMLYQINPGADGTGIGLAVVRKAAERMGGRVGVSSTPDEGSTFWLEFRLAAPSIAP